jgi:protein-S-isoprenylcysteine O-methyltransferase Ste14
MHSHTRKIGLALSAASTGMWMASFMPHDWARGTAAVFFSVAIALAFVWHRQGNPD